MRVFLSFTEEGQQVFYTADGKCSGLPKGAPVYTHHASLSTKYSMDPAVCVEAHRLTPGTLLSAPAISKMMYSPGDEAIRAQLGYLDEEDAPTEAELALVLAYKNGAIKSYSFLVGGKSSSQVVPLSNLEGCCKDLEVRESVTVAVDMTAIQFGPEKKATPWKKLDIMFKDSLSGSVDFSDKFVYARWRVLESKPKEGEKQPVLSLHLEALPLVEKLDTSKELRERYNSSNNIAISLASIPLKLRKPDARKHLFTTPCVVKLDECGVTDGSIRLGMASVRDVLRRGRPSVGHQECVATVSNPQLVSAWERSPRELHMAEVDTFEVVSKGNYHSHYLSSCIIGVANVVVNQENEVFQVAEVVSVLKQDYRVFKRGDNLIFGNRNVMKRKGQIAKYNSFAIVPPRTDRMLGPGAPEVYHSVIEEAIAASVAKDTKSSYGTAINMLAKCQETLGREMSLPLSDQDVLCFVAFMADRGVLDSTISSYLSAIRLAMLSVGHQCINMRTPVVTQVLKGIKNLKRDPQLAAQKKTRRAMTVDHLKLLGHALARSNWSEYTKSLVWAGSLVAFWGSARIGELMGPLASAFDPKSTLLGSDVQVEEGVVKVWVRSPKISSPTGDVLEVFETPDPSLDPVAAVKYFMHFRTKAHQEGKNLPFFVEEDGKFFTKQKFNRLLHMLMDPFVKDERDSLSGHSFRSGLATLMEAAGFMKSDIQAWGRWNSEAYKRYCKEKRPKRKIFAKLFKHL